MQKVKLIRLLILIALVAALAVAFPTVAAAESPDNASVTVSLGGVTGVNNVQLINADTGKTYTQYWPGATASFTVPSGNYVVSAVKGGMKYTSELDTSPAAPSLPFPSRR